MQARDEVLPVLAMGSRLRGSDAAYERALCPDFCPFLRGPSKSLSQLDRSIPACGGMTPRKTRRLCVTLRVITEKRIARCFCERFPVWSNLNSRIEVYLNLEEKKDTFLTVSRPSPAAPAWNEPRTGERGTREPRRLSPVRLQNPQASPAPKARQRGNPAPAAKEARDRFHGTVYANPVWGNICMGVQTVRKAVLAACLVFLTAAGNPGADPALEARRDAQHRINVSGRQRMLSQRIAKAACLAARDPANAQQLQEMADARALFAASMKALTRGSAEIGLAPEQQVAPVLEEATQLAESVQSWPAGRFGTAAFPAKPYREELESDLIHSSLPVVAGLDDAVEYLRGRNYKDGHRIRQRPRHRTQRLRAAAHAVPEDVQGGLRDRLRLPSPEETRKHLEGHHRAVQSPRTSS